MSMSVLCVLSNFLFFKQKTAYELRISDSSSDVCSSDLAARGRVAETFVWALPQVMRDGFTHFDEEAEVQAFDDVLFPLALGREAEVAPGFATAIVTSAGGHDRRNASWAEARTQIGRAPCRDRVCQYV